METDKIEFKSSMETAAVADYLTSLAAGFKAGRIVVEKDGEQLVLTPAAMSTAEVEIEARIKKDKAKFSLELSWRLVEKSEDGAELKISTELPRVVSKPGEKKSEEAKADAKKVEAKKTEAKQPEVKKSEENAQAGSKPLTQSAILAAKPAQPNAKSDVKPTAPAVNESGVRVVAAAGAPGKPQV